MAAKTFAEIAKFNPYHDSKGRFASSNSAASFTYAPGKSTAHDKAIQREKESSETGKGFKGTLYHGSPATDIEEFDIERAGANTSSGEKLIYFTDSKQMAEDFSYERLEGSSKYFQRRGEKGRVYEVDVEMKNPLDLRNLTDKDIDNILQLDVDGILTKDMVKMYAQKNHQLLKSGLELTAESLKSLGYDGLIANTGKAGHNSLEYAVVDSKQAKIRKAATAVAKTFDEVLKFNPYHDSRGRFASANSAASFTIRTKDPGKQHLADAAIAREKERDAAGGGSADSEAETPRMKAIHSVEDKIRNQNYESAAIIDKDGNELLFKDGGQRQVGFTPMECAMMKDNTLTHNHPSSSSFSAEDISCFVANDMLEIRATTREGNTFSLKQGEGYDRIKGAEFLMEFQQNARQARAIAQYELDAKGFQEKIWRGEITPDYANKEFGKIVTREQTSFCEKKAPDYNLEFTVEKRFAKKSADSSMSKAAGNDDDYLVLDKETEDLNDAAFNEWLNRSKPASIDEIEEVEKFNPYHDQRGRFTSAGSEASFTYAPGKSTAHDKAIERHKERMAAVTPTEAQEKALKGIESRTRNLKKEQFRVVDREGNVVMQKQGDKHSVSYSVGEARDNFPGNITIHNHPDGGTFSSADLSDIGHGATEIRAASPEGTYSLRNLNYRTKWTEGQKSWLDMRNDIDAASQTFKTSRQLRSELREPYEKQVKPLADKWAKMRDAGASQDELNKVAQEYTQKWDALKPQLEQATRQAYVDQYHHWYKANAGKYGFEYSFTPTKEKTRKSDTMDEIYEIGEIEKSSGEVVLDRKMNEDVQEIVSDVLAEYPRELTQEDTKKSFAIYKTSDDKRLVFGWASVSITVDGEQLEDRQQDIIDPEDLEEAAYEYVLHFRDTGEEHIQSLRKKGKLVESCVFTAEKQKAMGIPEGILPIGWWIGFKIEDDDAWEKVKKGTYKMFSIEGKACRVPVD